jgi:Ca2+-binding RTX toxin-like protein
LLFPGLNFGEAAGDTYFDVENLQGSIYDDHLGGDDVANVIHGNAGNDLIAGRGGSDELHGNEGNDILYGDDGDDALYGDDGADALVGGSGLDWAAYNGAPTGLTADLLFPAGNTGYAAGDTYFQIEYLQGSQFNDILRGDDLGNFIDGLNGNDYIVGPRRP